MIEQVYLAKKKQTRNGGDSKRDIAISLTDKYSRCYYASVKAS